MKVKNKFTVVKRDCEDCEHDTGVVHSVGLACDDVESMYRDFYMSEKDPRHRRFCHDPKIVVDFGEGL
jgi:hypothetical protein